MNAHGAGSRKLLSDLVAHGGAASLPKVLGPLSITSMGIGAIIGAGIFVLTGTAAALYAGPAVLVSFVPALVWMRFVTRKDDQRFRQIFVAAKLRVHDRNRRFWHARSYAPNLYRGARDAWHA